MNFIMCIALWMFLSGTVMFCDRLGNEASLLIAPRSVEDRGRYGFTTKTKERPRRRSGNRKTRTQLVDLVKRMRKSNQEHQPTPRNPRRQSATLMTEKRDERRAEKPTLKENPPKRDKGKSAKPSVRPKTWREILKERNELVFALMDQMVDLSSHVSENVLLMNHLEKHIYELETATKDRLEKVIKNVKKCHYCQESRRTTVSKDEKPKPRIGKRKLKKWLAEKKRLLDALTIQIEDIDPVERNVPMMLHLDGHIIDLQLAGKGGLGAVIAEIKKCKRCNSEGNYKTKKFNRKLRKLKEKRDDLIYELMIQVERMDPPNVDAIDHLEGHIWDLEDVTEVNVKSVMRNTKKCSCQAVLPKKKKACYRRKDWKNLLTERNYLIEELSRQLKAVEGNSGDSFLFLTVHLQKHQWLLQRAKVEDMEFLVEKVQKCWCQEYGTDEPESFTQETESLIETSSHHDSDIEDSSYHEFEDRPNEFHYDSGDILDEFHYEPGESSRETPVTPKPLLVEQLERVKGELIEKLNKWDGAIETNTAREQLSNERRALLVEREHFNKEKKDLEIQRKEFEEGKQAFELDYFTMREEIDRKREDLMKEQEALRLEWEAFQIEKEAFRLDGQAFQREKAAIEKERENLILEREKHEKDVREFNSRTEKIRKNLEAAGAKLISEKKQIDADRSFLLEKGKELLQRKNDNITKKQTKFPREPKNQCKNEWKIRRDTKVGNLEGRLVGLERQLNRLVTKIDPDKSFLLKEEKELLQRKSDNITKEKTKFPREPKNQCKKQWKNQQDTKVGNLEGRLVELERLLNRLVTNFYPDKSFLLKEEKELLQRKSDNITKEKTKCPREAKNQCIKEWKNQQDTKVGNLEGRLVELERLLNRLVTKTPD
ncbi:desmoplakin-like [Macrobrachium nipponense]|uniref:desmoplakin-like n=1 Tax=Macrobrachium nipponense TaxID=159736 RepID=UPI0030C8449F